MSYWELSRYFLFQVLDGLLNDWWSVCPRLLKCKYLNKNQKEFQKSLNVWRECLMRGKAGQIVHLLVNLIFCLPSQLLRSRDESNSGSPHQLQLSGLYSILLLLCLLTLTLIALNTRQTIWKCIYHCGQVKLPPLLPLLIFVLPWLCTEYWGQWLDCRQIKV